MQAPFFVVRNTTRRLFSGHRLTSKDIKSLVRITQQAFPCLTSSCSNDDNILIVRYSGPVNKNGASPVSSFHWLTLN